MIEIMPIEMIIWILTGKCNLNCIHCYASKFRGYEEMRLDEAKRFIKEISEYGVERVALTGGEPLLRRELPEILEEIYDSGMSCNMSTNLTCLDPRLASILRRYDVYLYISLDGAKPETYESIRGAGTWRSFMRGMDQVKKHEIEFSTVMAVCKRNLNEVRDYVELASKLGAYSACIIPVMPAGKADEELIPSRREMIYAVRMLNDACEELGYMGGIWCYKPAELLIDSHRIYVGGACRDDRFVDIDPSGNLLLCDVLDFKLANVKKGFRRALEEYYADELVQLVSQPELREPCISCRLRESCMGGCYARAYILKGDLKAPDPYCPLIEEGS